MNENDAVLIQDILDAARKIQLYVDGKQRADLEEEGELRGFAVAKGIEVIGEAANHISPETRVKLPSVEWGNIIGMRNRLIHAYTSIDYDIVWDVATNKIPVLISELEKILLDPQ
jgi:uncharacterized protein with HEPN domain